MSSILNKYKKWLPNLVLLFDKYWDFVISTDNSSSSYVGDELDEECLISYIDMTNEECITESGVTSLEDYVWDDAINSSVTLNDIGFTGMDNGLIQYDYNDITNQEFYDLLTKSKLELTSDDFTLKLNKVSGNTKQYSYDCEYNEDGYYSFMGGFLQGFYKLYNFDYQVLPTTIDNGAWGMEFVIRPKDYTEKENTLNNNYPGNKGIFFYMGTRAENKFQQYYGTCDLSNFPTREKYVSGFCENNYSKSKEKEEKESEGKKFWELFLKYYEDVTSANCPCVFRDASKKVEKKIETDCSDDENLDEEYFSEDLDLSTVDIHTSEGNGFESSNDNTFEVETDNKFLTFDRTKYGFTVDNYDENTQVVFTGKTISTATNLFLLMNHTKTGFTVDDFDKITSMTDEEIKEIEIGSVKTNSSTSEETSGSTCYPSCIKKDIINNSFALKVNEDGSIGYKALIKDCDEECGYKIMEEYSYSGMVKPDTWSVINVKFKLVSGSYDSCGKSYGNGKMKVYIYVNGYLKFVSQELPEFNFKELNETYDKQEGVPFNISLGGGTQGLADSVWLDYCSTQEKLLPIEENFAGTFIGDIKSFKFYDCSKEYNEIKTNYNYEKKNII